MDINQLWEKGSRSSLFKHKCTSCDEKTNEWLQLFKEIGFAFGDAIYYSSNYYLFCKECFFETTSTQRYWYITDLDILNRTKFSWKCGFCLEKTSEWATIGGGFRNKRCCINCFSAKTQEEINKELHLYLTRESLPINEEQFQTMIEKTTDIKYRKKMYKQMLNDIENNYCYLLSWSHHDEAKRIKKLNEFIINELKIKTSLITGDKLDDFLENVLVNENDLNLCLTKESLPIDKMQFKSIIKSLDGIKYNKNMYQEMLDSIENENIYILCSIEQDNENEGIQWANDLNNFINNELKVKSLLMTEKETNEFLKKINKKDNSN